MSEQQSFSEWCIVELFGHQKLAGLVGEQTIGGQSFVRVDVPKVDDTPEFTQFLGSGSIYRMTPVSEEIARQFAQSLRIRPVQVYQLQAPQPAGDEDNHEDYDYER